MDQKLKLPPDNLFKNKKLTRYSRSHIFFFKKNRNGKWCKAKEADDQINYFYTKANNFYKIINDLTELTAKEKEKNEHLKVVIKQLEKAISEIRIVSNNP